MNRCVKDMTKKSMIEADIKKYELEITANCNAECPLCARTIAHMPLRGNSEISLEEIKKVFPSKSSIQRKHFALCGVLGDPIVHPNCFEMCEWFTSNGGSVSLSTNGGYNNEQWWIKLAKLKNLNCTFAVDGFEDTNHIYRVNVKWDILLRNMKAYTKAGGKGKWSYIPFAHNEDDYEKAKELSKELGLNFIKRTSGRNALTKRTHKSRKMKEEVKLRESKKLPHNNLDELKKVITPLNQDHEAINKIVNTVTCQHYHDKDHSGSSAYIAADLTLWPCCYLYDQSLKNYEQVTKTTDKTFNSLVKQTVNEVLQQQFYKDLKERWYSSHSDHLRRCIKTCAFKGAYKNKEEHIA